MKVIVKFFTALLGDRRLRNALILGHVLLMIASFWLSSGVRSADEATYLELARSLGQGHFSYWGGLFDPPPADTYRTHGYPFFLWCIGGPYVGVWIVEVVQLLLYAATLALGLRLIARLRPGAFIAQNIFLLCAFVDIQLVIYPHMVFPETLCCFLCMLLMVVSFSSMRPLPRDIVKGVLMAVLFWVRPSFMLLSVALLLVGLVWAGKAGRWRVLIGDLRGAVVALVLGPLAFGLWNLNVHGTFSPAPLTGSAVISNIGIWQLKLPGYGSKHYFPLTSFGTEFFPWYSPDEAERNYASYQEQWQRIDAAAALKMTATDRERIPLMQRSELLFVTRSPAYTIALDQAIAEENHRMIVEDPGYYVLSRAYTAVRLWITNINMPWLRISFSPRPTRPAMRSPEGIKEWFTAIYPFCAGFILFGIGLPLLAWRVWRTRAAWQAYCVPLALVLYLWLVHIPMAMQSRYLIPVHLVVFLCYALAVSWPKTHVRERP